MSASDAYCSGVYREPRTVFGCMGKCAGRSPAVPSTARLHCPDCRLLLLLLSRIGIGDFEGSSTMQSLVRDNGVVDRWTDDLHKEIRLSTQELPHLLDNALQARGMSVVWGFQEREEIAVGTVPEDTLVKMAWRGSAMAMHVNTRMSCPVPIRHRLHIVPHNAGLMLQALIKLPHDATTTHAVHIIERHTLPLETIQ